MTVAGNRAQRRAQGKAHAAQQKKLASEPKVLEFAIEPTVLRGAGPILVTDVGVTDKHKALLERAGQSVPRAVRARLLVDTGATKSLVRHDIAERAGLKLINTSVPVHGVGVDTSGRTYLGRISFGFESKRVPGAVHGIWVDTEIASASLPANHIDGLIGRDVLAFFELTYNGRTGKLRMRFLEK